MSTLSSLVAMQVIKGNYCTPKQRQKHTMDLDITQLRYIGFGESESIVVQNILVAYL